MAKKSVRDYVNDSFSDEEKNLFNFIVESFPETVLIQDGEESEDILTLLVVLAKVFGKARTEIINLSTSHSAEELYEKIQKGVLVDQNKMLLLPLAEELKYQGIDYNLGLNSLLAKLAEERALVVDANMLVKNRGTTLAVEQIIKNLAEQKNFDYTSYLLDEGVHELDIVLNYILEEFANFEEAPVPKNVNEEDIFVYNVIKPSFLYDLFMSIKPAGVSFNLFITVALNTLFNLPNDRVIAGIEKESELNVDVKFVEVPEFSLTSDDFDLVEQDLVFSEPSANNKYVSSKAGFDQCHAQHQYVIKDNLPDLENTNILVPGNSWNSDYYKITLLGYAQDDTLLGEQSFNHFKGLEIRANIAAELHQDYWFPLGNLTPKDAQITTSTATGKVSIVPCFSPSFIVEHDSEDLSGNITVEPALDSLAHSAALVYLYVASVPVAYLIAHFWNSQDIYIGQKVLKEVSGLQNEEHRLRKVAQTQLSIKSNHFVGEYICLPLSSAFPNRTNIRKIALAVEKMSYTIGWELTTQVLDNTAPTPPPGSYDEILVDPTWEPGETYFNYEDEGVDDAYVLEVLNTVFPLEEQHDGKVVAALILDGANSHAGYYLYTFIHGYVPVEITGITNALLTNQYQVTVYNSFELPIKAWISDSPSQHLSSAVFAASVQRLTKTISIADTVILKRFFNSFTAGPAYAPAIYDGLISYSLVNPEINGRYIGAYFSERNDDSTKSDTVSQKVSDLDG